MSCLFRIIPALYIFIFFNCNTISMSKHWFNPKSYGWGFVPISWEGWLMTAGLIGILLLSAKANGFFTETISEEQGIRFLLDVLFSIGIFSYFAEKKTNGELKWRWKK